MSYPFNDRSLLVKTDTWSGSATGRSLVSAPGVGKQIEVLSILATYRPSASEYVTWTFKSGTTGTPFCLFVEVPNCNQVMWEGVFLVEANEALVVDLTPGAGTPVQCVTIQYRITGTGFE